MEATIAATRHGAALMRIESEVGQVRSGHYADLFVIDGNPLRGIRLFRDQSKMVGVIKGGRFAKRANTLSSVSERQRKAA